MSVSITYLAAVHDVLLANIGGLSAPQITTRVRKPVGIIASTHHRTVCAALRQLVEAGKVRERPMHACGCVVPEFTVLGCGHER